MKKKNIKFMLQPLGSLTGITILIMFFTAIAQKFSIVHLDKLIFFIPVPFLKILGVCIVVLWFPIFIAGVYSYVQKIIRQDSGFLIVTGIYKYIRNPMYTGASFTIIGIGLIINETGVFFAGILWSIITLAVSKIEERELSIKFGQEYSDYKKQVPMFFPTFDEAPRAYREEFYANYISLIKNRVRLFCILALGIYFLSSFLYYLFYPRAFNTDELYLWAILIMICSAILYFNKKANTIRATKLNAYLLTTLFLYFLAKVSDIYNDSAMYSNVSLYLFIFFLVSFSIPWNVSETLILGLLNITTYSILFWCNVSESGLDVSDYYGGIILIFAAILFAFVIRKKEMARDIESFIFLKEVEQRSDQMQKELELATRVHKTLIPKSMSTDQVDISVMYLPVYYMGGDYARFHFVDKDKLIFIICDVTGHGVSSALLVNRVHSEFEQLAREGRNPGTLLKELDDFITEDFEGINMYISAFCGLLDFSKMKLYYSNYGHPDQYIFKISESNLQLLKSQTTLIGMPVKKDEIYQNEIQFNRKDMLFLFTDGLTDISNKDKLHYGEKRLKKFILENHHLDVNRFNQKLLDELNSFKDENFGDDIFFLTLYIK